MADDIYGIPEGGNNGAWTAKKWKKLNYTLPWYELVTSIALGGWPKDKWATAAAVAAAESGRNPFIYNTYKMGHFGLFQISRAAWPEFFDNSGDGPLRWVGPWSNAKKAYSIYKQQGWKAWEGYTNGTYLVYLPEAKAAAKKLKDRTLVHPQDEKGFWETQLSMKTHDQVLKALDVSAADLAAAATQGLGKAVAAGAEATAEGTVSAGGDVAAAVEDTFGWMNDLWEAITTPAFWMRVAYGATGTILIVGGLMLIVRNTKTVQQATEAGKQVAGVIPGGKAVTAVKGAITKNEMAAQARQGGKK